MTSSFWERARHCPLCGSRLVTRRLEGRRRRTCPRCDFVLYLNPASAAAALVVRGREILLVRRAIEPYKNHWGIPAGFQEYLEPPEQAAVRETYEETGVRIELLGLLGLFYTTDDPRKRANLALYAARPIGGEPRPGADAFEVRWWPLEGLPARIAFENNRRFLEALLRAAPEGPILAALERMIPARTLSAWERRS